MAIKESLLNKTVDIHRIGSPVISTNLIGEISTSSSVLKSSGIKCRITTKESNEIGTNKGHEEPGGMFNSSKYLGFFKVGTDIRVGDRLQNPSNSRDLFVVDSVNLEPGGSTDSHIECDLTDTSHDSES